MPGNPPPPYESYVDALLDTLARAPGRSALTTADRTLTAGDLHDGVRGAATLMAAHGVTRASTVALLTGNHPEALIARYAANLLGARVVHLGHGTAPAAQAEILESTDPALLLVDPGARTAAGAARSRVPAVLTLAPGLFTDSPPAVRTPPGAARVGAARADDDWCLRFTGGTTGTPKLVRMAHGPYRRILAAHAAHLPSGPSVRFLACTSLAHMAGIIADATLLAGGSVLLHPAFDPADVLAAVERHRITDLWLLPPLLHELLDHPHLATTDVSSLRRLFYGGAPTSAARMRRAAEVFGPVLHGSYGQTEAGPITEVLPHEHAVTAPDGRITLGRPLPGVDIEIRNTAGTAQPPGDTGEIHVRTPLMMSGYWRRPDLTAAVLRDGWLATGDLGFLDADHHLHLVDRLKDIVIVVGGHVYPAEVEQLLLTHPAVAHCAAFGTRGAHDTEELHVAVVPAPGHTPRPDRLAEFVTARMGALYEPSRVHLVDRLPLTEAGKPDKNRLRATLRSAVRGKVAPVEAPVRADRGAVSR